MAGHAIKSTLRQGLVKLPTLRLTVHIATTPPTLYALMKAAFSSSCQKFICRLATNPPAVCLFPP